MRNLDTSEANLDLQTVTRDDVVVPTDSVLLHLLHS
jgi:hypothetical protein